MLILVLQNTIALISTPTRTLASTRTAIPSWRISNPAVARTLTPSIALAFTVVIAADSQVGLSL